MPKRDRAKNELRAYEIIQMGYGELPAGRKRLEVKKLGGRTAYLISTGVVNKFRQYFLTIVDLAKYTNQNPIVTEMLFNELGEVADKVSYYKRLFKTPIRKTKAYQEIP
jgi:hypothetical protein